MKQPIKMTPGDELHLTALMAPFSLNLVTGQDRQHLLGYGRAAFEAGKAGQCLHQIQEPAPVQAAPANGFELWWEDHMPKAGQSEAWAAWVELRKAAPAAVAVPDEREAFEAWAHEYGTWDVERDDVQSIGIASYTDVSVVVAWHAWQARAALAATPAADAPEVNRDNEPANWSELSGRATRIAQEFDRWILAEIADKIPEGESIFAVHESPATVRSMQRWSALQGFVYKHLVDVQSKAPAAAPVVLPEPDDSEFEQPLQIQPIGVMGGGNVREVLWNCTFMPEPGINLYTEQQVRALLATATGLPAQAVDKPEGVHADPYPRKCPITGRPYFMHLEHPEHGLIPTFGGPYDSYSMPYAEGEPTDPWHERELSVHRYDHDRGHWVEDESIPLRIIFDEVLWKLQEASEAEPQAQADARDALTPAARDVLAERTRQISAEGWTPERDDQYSKCELELAAACYAGNAGGRWGIASAAWPWPPEWWKPSEPRRDLEKAGALILAAIERIDRAAIAEAKGE